MFRTAWTCVGLAALMALVWSPVALAQEDCETPKATCDLMCYDSGLAGGNKLGAATAALNCLNQCISKREACNERNAQAAEQKAAEQKAAEQKAAETARRVAEERQREAEITAMVEKIRADLARRYPDKAVVEPFQLFPNTLFPRLDLLGVIPHRVYHLVVNDTLYFDMSPDNGDVESGLYKKPLFESTTAQSLGIDHALGMVRTKVTDGRELLVVVEAARSGYLRLHFLDLRGEPIFPVFETKISTSDSASVRWRFIADEMFIWKGRHVDRMGKIVGSRDGRSLTAYSVNLNTGKMGHQRNWPMADSVVIRPSTGAGRIGGAVVYMTSANPALLTCLDWDSMQTIFSVPISSLTAPMEFAETHWDHPLEMINPDLLLLLGQGGREETYSSRNGQDESGAAGAYKLDRNAAMTTTAPSISLIKDNPGPSNSTYAVFSKSGARLHAGFRSGVVLADDLVQVTTDGQSMELIDDTGHRVPLATRGANLQPLGERFFLGQRVWDGSKWVRDVYREAEPVPIGVAALFKALPERDHETPEQYRNRLASFTARVTRRVALLGYDAKEQLLQFDIGGLPYTAFLPPESAIQFNNMQWATLETEIRALTPKVFELLSPRLSAPGVPATSLAALRVIAPLADMSSAEKASGACRADLSHLAAQLPVFGLSELDSVRDSIIQSSVLQMMSDAKARGYTAEAAIAASLTEASEFSRVAREALTTAASVDGMGNSMTALEQQLRAQTLRPTDCLNVRNAALCAVIVNDMGAIASRATAEEMRCFKAAGVW